MTEVNRKNFGTVVPEIIQKLQSCTFISIDGEYTGLYGPDIKTHNSLFDSSGERYHKLKNGIGKFQISQFGIALFSRCWERNEYFVDAYNIYLYPVSFSGFAESDVIQCQVSSLNFLARNNFDFNKFIKEGVPYMRKDDRKRLRQYFKENPMFMRWMKLRDRNYFPRFIEKVNDEDAESLVQHLNGFTNVMDAISKSNKPVVGHNMLLDLVLIYKQFYEDLPDSYFEFKTKIHALFPHIYDSKHLASALRRDLLDRPIPCTEDADFLYDTTLFDLYVNTAKVRDIFVPFVTPINETRDRYRSELEAGLKKNLESIQDSHCHEAGLDAVITGAVFLRLAHISARRDRCFLINRTFPPTFAETLSSLNSWKNCVNIVRAPIRHINFNGNDPPIDKPKWIRVEGNSKEGKQLDISWIRNHIAKFGDIEILEVNTHAVLLACPAWSSARNLWSSLENEGYKLSQQSFHKSTKFGRLSFTAAVSLVAGFAVLTMVYLRKESL